MGDRSGLAARVAALNLNPEALQQIEVYKPGRKGHVIPRKRHIIPNEPGKINSLQIYAHITTNDGYIGPAEAEKGLSIFGKGLIKEAKRNPGKHPNIDILLDIAEKGLKVRSDVMRRYEAKPLPDYLAKALPSIVEVFGTPFHIYDERAIRENARNLNKAFSWAPQFINFFAVKACPNPFLLKILKAEGFGADCSSLPELLLADKADIRGSNIMFTSNDTPEEEYEIAKGLGAIINLDDISHIDFLEKHAGLPEILSFRYNPGPLRKGNSIMGNPEEAKYGLTREQLFEGYRILKKKGVKRFGLHTMIASNELNPQYFIETAKMLFELVAEISKKVGIKFEFINIGGGIGTPYKPEQKPVDLEVVSKGVKEAYENIILAKGLPQLKIYMECGRMITGPYGYLVAKVRHIKDIYKQYAGLDACMANLMRPALYGAFHDETVLGKENAPKVHVYDVTGSLCENNDKFAINRRLPEIEKGDIIVMHNAGAHGHAMGFNYNSKLRSKELLLRENGVVMEIRREETIDDHFRTLDFNHLKTFRA